jgi:hypothetical protein
MAESLPNTAPETTASKMPDSFNKSVQLLTAFSSFNPQNSTVSFPPFLHNLTLFKGANLDQAVLTETIATLRDARGEYYKQAYANTTRGTKGMAILTML